MNHSMFLPHQDARLAAQTAQLAKSNETAEGYGLRLNETKMRALILAEAQTQRDLGRLEFGEGILPRLLYAFCDSPYMTCENWLESLIALQELFYTFKNELDDALTDDELLEAMHTIFHGKAQGSFTYLENMATDKLFKALRSDGEDGDDDDD